MGKENGKGPSRDEQRGPVKSCVRLVERAQVHPEPGGPHHPQSQEGQGVDQRRNGRSLLPVEHGQRAVRVPAQALFPEVPHAIRRLPDQL